MLRSEVKEEEPAARPAPGDMSGAASAAAPFPRAHRHQAASGGVRRCQAVSGGHEDHFLPQHSSVPVWVSLLSTPATALAAISVTPVSV